MDNKKPGLFGRIVNVFRRSPRNSDVERLFVPISPYAQGYNFREVGEVLQAYALDSPWLRGVVGTIATSVASSQILVYVPKASEDKVRQVQNKSFSRRHNFIRSAVVDNTIEEASPDHPLNQLLSGRHTPITGFMLMYITQVYQELVGEAFWYLERNKVGVPIAAYPIKPSLVQSIPTKVGEDYVLNLNGQLYRVKYEDMVYFRWASPVAPLGRGSGIGHSLRQEVSSDRMAGEMIAQRFASQGMPMSIIYIENVSNQELEKIKRRWLDEAHELWVAGVPMLMNRKFDAKEYSTDFQSLQFAELRQIQRDVFINAFGIPPEIIGHQKNANRSTINAAEYLYNKLRILPRLEANRQVIQNYLAPQYKDSRLLVHFENPVDEDREFQLRAFAQNPDSVKVDEWRTRLQGLPPIGGEIGESLLIRTNRMIVDKDGNGRVEGDDQENDTVEDDFPGPNGSMNGLNGKNGYYYQHHRWSLNDDE
jgi:hypothetical protein